MPLRVAWFAPKAKGFADLDWLNELGRIQNIPGVVVTTRTGNDVDLDDVAALLSIEADVMVWSGHGKAGGLLLSDGVTLVQPRWLAMQVALGARPRVAVLAACGSQDRDEGLRSLTEVMCRAGVPATIGFPAETADPDAAKFTVELVRALAINSEVDDAFDVAMEAISSSATARGIFLTPGIQRMPFNLDKALANIQDTLDILIKGQSDGGIEIPVPRRSAIHQPVQLQEIEKRLSAPLRGHIRGLADTGPTPPAPSAESPAALDASTTTTAPAPAVDVAVADAGGKE